LRLSPPGVASCLLLAAVLAGCYNPEIGEGAFVCGQPGDVCPSGFSCREGRCYKGTPASDGGGDSPINDGPVGDADCVGPLPCTPPPSAVAGCDPVCQTGCGCKQRCTNPGSGNVCQAATGTLALYDTCNPSGDTCRPGAVCLPEFQDRCGAHCYRFCRVDDDCPGMSRCKAEAHDERGNLLYKVCSPRIETCNPIGAMPRCGPAGNADRPWPNFACYMLSVDSPEDSVCECAGTLAEGAVCDREYSCVPGNECVPVGSDTRCRRLCTPGAVPTLAGCPVGQNCVALASSRTRGFCM
jgi:hypothetical protein